MKNAPTLAIGGRRLQKRTSLVKFARSPCKDPSGILDEDPAADPEHDGEDAERPGLRRPRHPDARPGLLVHPQPRRPGDQGQHPHAPRGAVQE